MRKHAPSSLLSAMLIFAATIFSLLAAMSSTFAGSPYQTVVQKTSGAPDGAQVAAAPDEDRAVADDPSKEIEADSLDGALDLIQAAHEYWLDGNEGKALEALDEAYRVIVSVKNDDDPKVEQQKEDLRFTISKRILEIYASRYTAAKGTHRAIPLTVNRYVQREIELFKGRERTFFLNAYRRSGQYRGRIVKALQEAGLPEELSWLPLIESGFKTRALSRSRALGLWQFIPSTGYKYGLHRTAWIDERMDPERATTAAIAYLKELHAMFGDWATVLAAYNCGEGTVLRAISRQKAEYLDNFWDLYERLPQETARYYPRFLAVLAILKDPARYGMALDPVDQPAEYEIVQVQKQVGLRSLAQPLGVAFEELTVLNPALRRYVTPAGPYDLKVPAGKGSIVFASLEALPERPAPKNGYVLHRVRRGENLTLLALKYRTSIMAIEDTNHLRGSHLVVGQKLKIPVEGRVQKTTGT